MTKRMLVDATHPEETRVVVVDNDQLVDFDFESAAKRQLKGNIYLAKVTRVEPSLQAAFVEYGGNRHGFLAFSEIHSDYYQIPQADREKLAELASQTEGKDADPDDAGAADEEPAADDEGEAPTVTASGEDSDGALASDEAVAEPDADDAAGGNDQPTVYEADLDLIDDSELRARERARMLRSYRIQEVIKRRQILLVQVVKEERGNKGAALTTYISLPGRYCVLMPNTPRGGGISRKISVAKDRTRLKKIAGELDVPQGMGLIIRTAGQTRTKAEIKRDYDYLLRLWSDIRDRTLESIAPCLIFEEADIIQRAMRDLYTSDIEDVLVEGDIGYRSAKKFMTMLMPSRARRVKPYREQAPLFFKHKIEERLDAMYEPMVRLKSGGSIVIHTTEALTAIDVNSGKSTRERHIDETALRTNLEAADEVARQMRLRDIAGLVVIDFIDMGEHRHQRQVEKRLREALKIDRARLQIGRISSFGLLELSRQRLRPSLQELSGRPCPSCGGTGVIRSTESAALQAIRRIEMAGIEGKAALLAASLPADVVLYIANHKRVDLARLETRYDLSIHLRIDDNLSPQDMEIEKLEPREARRPVAAKDEVEEVDERFEDETTTSSAKEETTEDDTNRKRRRRRKRRRPRDGEEMTVEAAEVSAEEAADRPKEAADAEADGETAAPKPRRRRRRRGGKPTSPASSQQDAASGDEAQTGESQDDEAADAVGETVLVIGPVDESDEDAVQPVDVEAEPVPMPAPYPNGNAEQGSDPASPHTLAEEGPHGPRPDETEVRAEHEVPDEGDDETGEPQPSLVDRSGSAQNREYTPSEGADEDQEEAGHEKLPEPAMAEEVSSGPPRQGWWNRLVRRDG